MFTELPDGLGGIPRFFDAAVCHLELEVGGAPTQEETRRRYYREQLRAAIARLQQSKARLERRYYAKSSRIWRKLLRQAIRCEAAVPGPATI
jgi:hypothetical protein